MFNNNRYSEINREERFFCFLFAHAMLMSRSVRVGFAELAKDRCNSALNPDALEVYVEAAALRDYWYDLGNPTEYLPKTGKRRREVLVQILNLFELPAETLDNQALFWTSNKEKKKLWSPSHWNIEALKAAELDKYFFEDHETHVKYSLIDVRWAFSAKPDILLISPESALVIEAKLESAEGCKAQTGYEQYKIQNLISKLWQLLIPEFKERKLELAILEVKPSQKNSIQWSELVEIIAGSDVDDFTRKALEPLKRYYRTSLLD